MMHRTPPAFRPGPLTYEAARELTELARAVYGSLLGKFSAAPPLQVRNGLDGVAYSLGVDVGAGGVITRKNSGTPDFGPEPRINFIEGPNIVIGMADDGTEIDITITATAPAGAGIGTREVDLTPSYTGVSTLTFDQADGFSLSQPIAGETRIDLLAATVTQAGIVSLVAQSMGAGAKYFNDKVGIGTTSPLANSALDVRGYTYVYFSGLISFGGGNTPIAESDGCVLQYDGSVGAKNISLSIPPASYAAGMAGGVLIRGTNAKFRLRHKTASARGYGYTNDDTSANEDGVTGTGGGGDTVVGGIITALGALAGGTGITIGVVGNTVTVTATLTSPLTTKGDIWCYSTTDTRRSVGTNGQVLTADSTDATGLKWTTLSIPTTANSRITTVDQTTTLLTAQNITGLSFAVNSGEVWSFECYIRNNKSALTAGIKYAVNAPATSTLEGQIEGTTSATTAVQNERISALATLTTAAFNTVANAEGFVRIVGVVVAGGNGTVQIQHASVTSGTATARINSYITARKIS